MKKLISGAAAVCVLVSGAAGALAATFTDVPGTAYGWAQPYIEDMAEKGLISGYSDGSYKPGNSVSRIETISLFARAMGSRDEVNAKSLEYALEQYGSIIDTYKLNFGTEDVAYMMYRGALTEAEAKAYLAGDEKNKAMQRHEAATIITKVMGGETEAKSNLMLDMDYTDVSDIPRASKPYVYYVTQKNIMSGMTDGSFSPKTSVLRSQIAVMLSNTVDALELSCNPYKLTGIDTAAMNISLVDEGGEESVVNYSENTVFTVEGKTARASEIPTNVGAVVTMNFDGVMFVDITSAEPDREVYAIYSGYANRNGILTLSTTTPGSGESVNYTCKSGINKITKNGNKATILDFKTGDYLHLTIEGGEVTAIDGVDKETTIKGATIEAINYSETTPTVTISHTDKQYDGMVIEVGKNATVMKDGAAVDMNAVYRGDKVTLTLEYGVISKVAATSTKRTLDGTIRAVSISSNPTITVSVNGKDQTFDVTNDIAITVNGEEATLYDFRVGDKVTLTLESEAVTRISSTVSQATSGTITGTVLNVNASFKFIKVQVTDTNGSTYEETVYCNDSKTTFITAQGSTKQFRDVKEGSVVACYGASTNGAFEATSIIIVK